MNLKWTRNPKGRGRHIYILREDGIYHKAKISLKKSEWRIRLYTNWDTYYYPERFSSKDEAMAVAGALVRLS